MTGKIYVVGGNDGHSALNSIEIYDPEAHTWFLGPSLGVQRANVGVAVMNDRLYAVGGFNGKKFLNSIEFLDLRRKEYWRSIVPKGSEASYQQNGVVVENGTRESSSKTGSVTKTGAADGVMHTSSQNGGQGTEFEQSCSESMVSCSADLKQEIKVNGERNS